MLQIQTKDTDLGAALLQDGQPVVFTSSTLSATIGKSVKPSKSHLKRFTNTCMVVVHSGHQLLVLETIFKKPLRNALKLKPFKFTVVYKRRKYMYMYRADALSRLAFKMPATSGNVLLSLAEGSPSCSERN